MAAVGNFILLRRYLEDLDPAQAVVVLSFAAIEALIRGPLPASARTAYFWSASVTARLHWQPAGFAAHRHSGAVTFTRIPR